jgi:hypothetical protein
MKQDEGQMRWPKGSKWRKWDLHVHSPASGNFKGDWNQFIIQIGNADCDVIGINDYFSVAGYKEVQRRLSDPGAPAEGNKPYREALEKLKAKTLLPVVECRMNNVVVDKKFKSGPRINFHLIFSPGLPADDIETFIKNLKVKGNSIGSRYNEPKFLLDEVSVHFGETCNALRNDGHFLGRFLIWIPYDEYGGIDNINPETDTLFKEGLIYDADILGSSNKMQADFFLWKSSKFTEEQYRKWFGRRKPCIKGSDSHNVNDELGKLKDRKRQLTNTAGSRPTLPSTACDRSSMSRKTECLSANCRPKWKRCGRTPPATFQTFIYAGVPEPKSRISGLIAKSL